jgi:hypothetical protein
MRGGLLEHAVELGSDVMMYIQHFIMIRSGIPKIWGGGFIAESIVISQA